MKFTADNMSSFLGNLCTDEDAVMFGSYLKANGWELVENTEFGVDAYQNGERMTNTEWQAAIEECFE